MPKTILDVYRQYQLMPNLQTHQLRVASVAKLIADGLTDFGETEAVVTACLLHDMGNIIKFELQKFPQFLEPEGLDYWKTVQADFFDRFGQDEHEATLTIARELGVSDRVYELIDSVGFGALPNTLDSGDVAKMICEYSDLRVTPFGVVSLQERFTDLKNRYQKKYPSPEDETRRERLNLVAQQIESHLFARASLKPSQLTDLAVNDTIGSLKSWPIAP